VWWASIPLIFGFLFSSYVMWQTDRQTPPSILRRSGHNNDTVGRICESHKIPSGWTGLSVWHQPSCKTTDTDPVHRAVCLVIYLPPFAGTKLHCSVGARNLPKVFTHWRSGWELELVTSGITNELVGWLDFYGILTKHVYNGLNRVRSVYSVHIWFTTLHLTLTINTPHVGRSLC